MVFEGQFAGKIIAITGAASGIGLATAKILASRGAKLSLADLSAEKLQDAATAIKNGNNVEILTEAIDVREYSQVEAWITKTKSHFGQLDGAANLAGVIPQGFGTKGVEELELADWGFVLAVNLTGVMHCLKAQLPVIGPGGSVVNASSVAGLVGAANNSSYVASKHGVIGLTSSAAKEVGRRNIRVNAICPGRIYTPLLEAANERAGILRPDRQEAALSNVALGRMGQPEEVAKLITFLLSEEASYITGGAYTVDGGWVC